jgi:hypothetical protein
MEHARRSTWWRSWFVGLAFTLAWQLGSDTASAQATNVERRVLAAPDELAEAMYGLKFGLSAGVFFFTPQDRVGCPLQSDFFYHFRVGRLVLAPGARIAGYFTKAFEALAIDAAFCLGLPLGPVFPFLVGGAGFGYQGHPKDYGIAYAGGGGVLVALRKRLSIGTELSYQGFALASFRATNLAAYLQFSY